jgi:hypothetical protein
MKKLKILKKPKKTKKNIFSGFFGGFFWVGVLGGIFIANPADWSLRDHHKLLIILTLAGYVRYD